MNADVVVVGGGMAGLACAWALLRAGVPRVVVLEQETTPGQHASGRNAGIFRQLEGGDDDATDAARVSAVHMRELEAVAGHALIQRTGVLYLAREPLMLDALRVHARACGIATDDLSPADVVRAMPLLEGGPGLQGVAVPSDGTLDVAALVEVLARQVRGGGGHVVAGSKVEHVVADGPRGVRVTCSDGTPWSAAHVVVAAGAWSAWLGGRWGLPLETVRPLRRHLALLQLVRTDGDLPEAEGAYGAAWRVDAPVYARRFAPAWLVSPADEDVAEPGNEAVTADLAERLHAAALRLGPRLADARLARAWACQRTMAADRKFVVGTDPRWPRLAWCTALGGRGMSCGLGVAQRLAMHLLHGESLPAAWSPARLVDAAPWREDAHA